MLVSILTSKMINSETTQNTVNSIYEVFKSNIVLENKNTSTKSTSQQTQDNITSFSKQIKTGIHHHLLHNDGNRFILNTMKYCFLTKNS